MDKHSNFLTFIERLLILDYKERSDPLDFIRILKQAI